MNVFDFEIFVCLDELFYGVQKPFKRSGTEKLHE